MAELAPLAAYLARAARTRFGYGDHDCLQGFVSGWIALNLGGDPAAPWRGRYRTALGCARLVRREGGVAAILARGAAAAGMIRTSAATPGCVGAVEMITARGLEVVGAIRTDRGWACRTKRGVLVAEARAVEIWAFPWPT